MSDSPKLFKFVSESGGQSVQEFLFGIPLEDAEIFDHCRKYICFRTGDNDTLIFVQNYYSH
jgi:hypothetical protein